MASPEQLRMARAKLNYSQGYVAEKLGIAHTTLSKIEKGESDSPISRINEIRAFYENEGLEFIEDNGVREAKAYVRRYYGQEGFRNFMNELYKTAQEQGGEICLFNAKPNNWYKWLGKEWFKMHSDRMAELLPRINMKITVPQGELKLISNAFAEYRWFPQDLYTERSFYTFGNKLAFVDFNEDDVQVLVLDQREFTLGINTLFNIAWNNVAIKLNSEGQAK